MKSLFTIICILLFGYSYCQNRYSTYTPSSSYQSTSFSEMMSIYKTSNNSRKIITCNELYEYITNNGYKKAIIESYTLQSSWLSKVTAYEYDYKIYVVAEIKENEYSSNTKSYIFCAIPNQNWASFRYASYGDSDSYGERFHKYIFDYKCNCQ